MATQPTNLPVPSESPRDAKFNAGKIDEFATSLAQQYIDRFGKAHYTIEGLKQLVLQQIYNLGWNLRGSFQDGGTVTSAGDLLQDESTNIWYRWDDLETLPKTVPSGSTPASSGGTGVGKWQPVDVADVLRKDLASSSPGKGASLVVLESGETVQQSITALKEKTTQNDYASFKNASVHKNALADGGTIAIECYGDSTMWGSTSLNSTVQNPVNPPAVFQRTMDLLFGTGKASITNKAIRGTALFSMLAGTDGSGSTFEAKMQVTTASVIYCNHAQNDCNSFLRTVSQYKADLITFVNTVRKYGKTPVLVTPNLTIVLDGITEAMTKRLPAFVDAMRSVAEVMGVDLVDNYYYTFKSSRYVRGYDIVPDGVHPGTDVYAMCGRNLAIPLISARVLAKPGDLSSLSNVTYRDNITSGRNFRNANSMFTKQLSWDAVASQTGIYYPFILDNPTDDTVIGIGGFQWGGGGKTIIGYNDSLSDPRLSGTLDQLRTGGTDENAFYVPQICKLLPGLQLINILNHSSSGGISSSFSGIILLSRRDVSSGYVDGSGNTQSRPIMVGDEITFSCYVNAAAGVNDNLFVLTETLNTTTAWLTLNNGAGTITLGMNGGATLKVATGVQTGMYNVRLTLNTNRTVSILFGAVSATTAAASSPLATCYVSTRGLYNVRKP